MPIIASSPKPISMDVQGGAAVSVSGAGAVEGAISDVGQKIADAASNVFIRLRHAEAESVVLDHSQRQAEEAQTWLERERLKSRDGYAYDDNGNPITNLDGSKKPLTDHYKEWADKNFVSTQESLPSPYAQELYRARMGQFYHQFRENVWNTEMKTRLSNIGNLRDDRVRRHMNQQVEAPNIGGLYGFLDSERQSLKAHESVIYSPSEVHDLDTRLIREVPEGIFNGLEGEVLSKKRMEVEGHFPEGATRPERIASIQSAISILNGEDPDSLDRKRRGMPVISEIMDPERKAHWLDRFNTMLESAKQHDRNDWGERLDRMTISLQSGERGADGSPMVGQQAIHAAYQEGVQLHGAGAISDLELVEKMANVTAMFKSAPVMNSWQFYVASPEKKQATMDQLAQDAVNETTALLSRDIPGRANQLSVAGAGMRARIRGQLEQLKDAAAREAEGDFPMFARKNPGVARNASAISYADSRAISSPAVRSAVATNDRQIENMWGDYSGAPKSTPPAYLTKPEAESIGVYLNGNDNSDRKGEFLRNLHRANPKTYNHKINQLIQDKKLSPAWYVALSIGDDKVFADTMVNAITNPVPDPEAILSVHDTTPAEMKAMIAKKSESYISALISKNPQSPITSREVEAVNVTLFNMAVQSVAAEKVSPRVAADRVVEALVDRRFLKADANPSIFASSAHRIPKVVAGVSLMEEDLKFIERNLGSYRKPETIQNIGADIPDNLDPRIPRERFYETAAGSIRFRLNQAQTAYIPTWLDSYHQKRLDLTKNGRPIEIPILELRKYNPENDPGYEKLGRKIIDASGKAGEALKGAAKGIGKLLERQPDTQVPGGLF